MRPLALNPRRALASRGRQTCTRRKFPLMKTRIVGLVLAATAYIVMYVVYYDALLAGSCKRGLETREKRHEKPDRDGDIYLLGLDLCVYVLR
jgi:hypothetical protein